MAKNLSKIYRQTAFIILVIVVSGLLNICLFAFQVKAAAAQNQPPILNFAYDSGGDCAAQPMAEPAQSLNRPSAPLPKCCLAQNRNFNALVNTANDRSAPSFANLITSSFDNHSFENNSTHYTARLTYPPPEDLALASIIIRE